MRGRPSLAAMAVAVLLSACSDVPDELSEDIGPLAGNWGPVGSAQICFPLGHTDGRFTQTGLVIRNPLPTPIEIVGFSLGPNTSGITLISEQMVPMPSGPILGTALGAPPVVTPSEAKEYGLDRARSANGYVLTPAGTDGAEGLIAVGLQVANPKQGGTLDHVEVTYRSEGREYAILAPETVRAVNTSKDCAT